MGIRLRGEPAAARLRRALDNPDNRRDRHDHPNPQKHRPAFYYALYIFLKDDPVGRNVYRRIIQPAEYEKNGSTLLDPVEFREIVHSEFSDRAEPPSVIQPASEAESLSLFALAYALREKDSSYQILQPLLELGPAFQLFFGAYESPEATVSAKEVSQKTEQSEPISDLGEVGKPARESLPEDQGKASLETTRSPLATGASPERIAPAVGKRLAAVTKKTTELANAQSLRRELGFAVEFDAQSFDKARSAEINAREALDRTISDVRRELVSTLDDLLARLGNEGIEGQITAPDLIDAHSVASWLDQNEPTVTEVVEISEEISLKRSFLRNANSEPPPKRQSFLKPLSLSQTLSVLRSCSETLDALVLDAEDWQQRSTRLRGILEDCCSPLPSKSLLAMDEGEVEAILRRTAVDEGLDALAPLFFRLLLELGDPKRLLPDLICETLNRAADAEDFEIFQESVSYISPDGLRRLLSEGHEDLSRQIVLATLRESLARRDAFFLTEIWPYEESWPARNECVGERLERLFSLISQLYWRRQHMPDVLHALATSIPTGSATDKADRNLALSQNQARMNLARHLESPINMIGHFYQLRNLALIRFFRPLADTIRNGTLRDIQSEFAVIERTHKEGELEGQILHEIVDRRRLRPAHLMSLKRYVDTNLELVRGWLSEESAALLDRADGEDDLGGEIRHAIEHLPPAWDKSRQFTGSLDWLEASVRKVISSIADNEWPEPSLAFFGRLPSGETLFTSASACKSDDAQSDPWPEWLDHNPRSERSWVSHLRGNVSWKDILQDGVAKILLKRERTPVAVLESLIAAGEYEAAIEAGRFPDFDTPESFPIVRKAEEISLLREEASTRFNDLDGRVRHLRLSVNSASQGARIEPLEAKLISVLDSFDTSDPGTIIKGLYQIEEVLTGLEEDLRVSESERERRLAVCRHWLVEADHILPDGSTVEEAERLVSLVKEQQAARRKHLVRLLQLDQPQVPNPLREAVRRFLEHADTPLRWPNAGGAADADLYIEYLVETAQDWWLMLGSLDPGDLTYKRINSIAELLASHLPGEIDAIMAGRPERATMLGTLFTEPAGTILAYCNALQARGLAISQATMTTETQPKAAPVEPVPVEAATTEPVEAFAGEPVPVSAAPAEPLPVEHEDTRHWLLAQVRVEAVVPGDTGTPVSGRTVQDAYLTFGAGRYRESMELAAAALGWVRKNDVSGEGSPLLAIFAWSLFKERGRKYERAELDALGLLLRSRRRILERAKGLSEATLLDWCVSLTEGENLLGEEPSLGERPSALLLRLANTPPGGDERKRFANLLQIAGAPQLAEMLWHSVRGKEGATPVRTALLLVLYELGENEALDHLFRFAGLHRKYLSAFIELANRSRSEPSLKLYAAVRQSLRSFADLKDRAFRDFASKIVARLPNMSARVDLEVSPVVEPDRTHGRYSLVIQVIPDDSDPPLSLRLELLENDDFMCANGTSPIKDVVKDSLLFDRCEIEYIVIPKDPASASNVAVRVSGETTSGQSFDDVRRFRVRLANEDDSFEAIAVENLLDAYPGYDGRPVSGAAFVGREEEIAVLERGVARQNPGAIVLYGVRRLGKTSLLDELRRRRCVTVQKHSQTLFFVVPVDEFSLTDSAGRPFLDRFLKHIWNSVLNDTKNQAARLFYENIGVGLRELEAVGRLEDRFIEASFLTRLREYLRRLRELASGRVTSVVLVFDEFDKLLEHYHSGYEAEVEELTNQLRRAATEEPNLGLVLAGSDLMEKVLNQYRNALYGSATVVHLGTFDREKDRDAARRIVAPEALKNRRQFSDQVVADIVRFTGGHPLYMRLVACAAVWISRRRRISRGTVIESISLLLRNQVLQGYLPDVANVVTQPMQVIGLLTPLDQALAHLLLLVMARHTTLERPAANWGPISTDDRLLGIRGEDTWLRIREELVNASLIVPDEHRRWAFRYPILGERLRINLESEFEHQRAVFKQLPNNSELRESV